MHPELKEALKTNDTKKLKTILENSSVDVNTPDKAGETPMILAIKHEHIEAMRLLIEHGVDVSIPGENKGTPLYYATLFERMDMINLLIEHGATDHPSELNRALRCASIRGNMEVAKLLIGYGADVNHPNASEETPLLSAAHAMSEKVMKLLIANGADIPIQNRKFNRVDVKMLNILKQCKTLKSQINKIIEQEASDQEKDAIKAIATSIVFSSDTPLPAASQFEALANEAVIEATKRYTKIQSYDKSRQNLILGNIHMIDDSLQTVNVKNWDVVTLGPKRTIVNLAALYGDKIQGIDALKNADAKTLKAFIDAIPVDKSGLPKPYSVGEFKLSKSGVSRNPIEALDKRIGGRGVATQVASFLGHEGITQLAKHTAPSAGRQRDPRAAAEPDGPPTSPRRSPAQKPSGPSR